jgi:cytidylate kinase
VIIAIDGPAGSGKTTIGRMVAEALHFALVDTGLFYRAVTVEARRRGIAPDDVAGLSGPRSVAYWSSRSDRLLEATRWCSAATSAPSSFQTPM